MSRFKCTKCGACCKIIGCTSLTKDNLCSIYEKRPVICRVKGHKTTPCEDCRQMLVDFKMRRFTPPKRTISELQDYLLVLLNQSAI